MKKKCSMMILPIVSLTGGILGVGVYLFLKQPSFGKLPAGERLERIGRSPNYRAGRFVNQVPTRMWSGDKSRWHLFWKMLFSNRNQVRPKQAMPVIPTDVRQIPDPQNALVWFGHSSCWLQIDGKHILVDPVFCQAAPVSFINKPFAGTDIFHPEKMPDIDVLIITHDHWDHLDYQTVKSLQGKVRSVVCPLGVGAHFEYWGYEKNRLCELDWSEQTEYEGLTIHCLPARHFSGRGTIPNKTLWASFLIEAPSLTIYIGGDGGYGPHFRSIGQRFPKIDWAILENGQYSENWKFIHTLPNQLESIVSDLKARHVVTVHHSKYALSQHSWQEPLQNAENLRAKVHGEVWLPLIGEIVPLDGHTPPR